MKVTSVELHPEGVADVHILSFRDPRRENPYNVREITGLDADDIQPKFYGVSGDPVANFHNMGLVDRLIGMHIDLNPNFSLGKTYSDLRDDLYRIISSSRTGLVQIQFKNGVDVVAVISGFVSKFETPHFDRNPTIKISFKTTEAMLVAPNPVTILPPNIDDDPIFEGGKWIRNVHINDPLSTSPHGFQFQATVTAVFGALTIEDNVSPIYWNFMVSPTGGFLVGDVLHFSSEMNKKELYIVRGVDTIQLADKIATGSLWPVVFPKNNTFTFEGVDKYTLDSISYYPTYWGV